MCNTRQSVHFPSMLYPEVLSLGEVPLTFTTDAYAIIHVHVNGKASTEYQVLCSVALLYKFGPIVETAQKGLMQASLYLRKKL